MEDLLSRIRRETHERLEELRGAVDERDRLAADLRALDAVPEPAAADPEPLVVCEPAVACEPVVLESPVFPEVPPVAPAPPVHVVRCPARREPLRRRMVSSKVARLMHAPRRPALERSGIVRVSEGTSP